MSGIRVGSVLRIALICGALAVSGCVKTFHVAEGFKTNGSATRILVMPSDVELSALTAAGLTEPRADWTEAGKTNVETALAKLLGEKKVALTAYGTAGNGGEPTGGDIQLIKLHRAVGTSILLHQYIDQFKLPAKNGAFDWTLGSTAAELRERHGTDYALFVFMRDSFATGGRAAVILIGAVLGVGIPGGQQTGFASLVDLRSGEVVWFNLHRSGGGDLREGEAAETAVKSLLTGLPL